MVTRRSVREWLEERFFVRIHMTLILAGTFLAGLVTTRLLMQLGVNALAVRYAIAVCLAYLVFLLLVKLWLLYVAWGGVEADVDPFDAVELGFDGARAVALQSDGGGDGFGSGLSGALDFGGDDLGGIVFMIVLIVIVLLLGGIAIYYIYMAPAVLGEAFFEVLLAASIARRAKKAEGAGWLGAVSRATMLPFVGVLALSILLGWLAQRHCPDALKLRDAVSCEAVHHRGAEDTEGDGEL
jgi:hypothetical protein